MLPDCDDYLSSDDTDMEEGQTNYSSTKLPTAENLVAEMDYSLLAVDMQNLLHISRTEVTEKQPPSQQVSRRPSIKMNEMEDIADHRCLFCTGNFTAKDMLSKHMLRVHHKDVLGILSQYSNTHDYLKCPFCVYRLSEKQKKLFLLHLEKKHSFEFVASIKEFYSSLSVVSSTSEISASSESQGAPPKPNLPVPFHVMRGKKGFLWNHMPQDTRFSFRRKLQFYRLSKKEPTNQVFYLKENAPSIIEDHSMSKREQSAVKRFFCMQCQESFSYNALLLNHINLRHRGPLKSVQPL